MANIGGPSLMKRTLGLQNDRYSQYIGPTTDFEPSLIDLSPFDPQDESLLSRGTLRKVSDKDTFLMLPDYNTPGYEHELQDADAIEGIVGSYGPALIDLYFYIIHPNFPILQKNVFLEKYGSSHREISPPLLAAVYILAINWWDHSEVLTQHPRPNLKELERLARTTLADVMYRPKLSTIQAGLLLSQRPEGDQWAPTAQLVAIGQELGLHLDCSHWKIPLWERSLRKRLAWALYMQDKWGSLVHGRPSHIFATNWAVQPLSPNDFPDVEYDASDGDEAEEYERGRQLFTQMISLSQILAEVLETFYTLGAMAQVTRSGTSGTHLVLSLAKPVQLKLKEWYAALPTCLKMDAAASTASNSSNGNGNSARPKVSSTGFLHLAYFATEITLHRRIVRSLSLIPEEVRAGENGDAASSISPVDPYVQHICRSAAKTRLISAMDFVNRLTPSHLRAFWYFASKTNFALIGTFGSLLWATAPGREEAEFYRARLSEFRWTLGVSAGRGGSGANGERDLKGVKGLTEFAIGMLDTSTGLLNGLPEKPVLSRRGSEMGYSNGPQGVSSTSSFLGLGIARMGQSYDGYNLGVGFGISGTDMTAGSADGSHDTMGSPTTSTSSGFEAYLAAHPVSNGMDLGYGDR
ncbi:MAG: Fungal specific transcription factor [Claussenomyces sp. TS43310]|nr:MAG: Fungal specific transcription factor [Claussenomyces sp. TS43310]